MPDDENLNGVSFSGVSFDRRILITSMNTDVRILKALSKKISARFKLPTV